MEGTTLLIFHKLSLTWRNFVNYSDNNQQSITNALNDLQKQLQ